jgi:hypothetical protein
MLSDAIAGGGFVEKADIGQPVVPELSSARCYGSSTSESGKRDDESYWPRAGIRALSTASIDFFTKHS